jgi:hypothetical protein
VVIERLQNMRSKLGLGKRIARVLGLGAGLATLALACPHGAVAATNLITNGSMAITGGSQSYQFGTYGGYTAPTGAATGESLAGWSSTSYGFVFTPSSTTAIGVYGNLSLYSTTTTPSTTFNNASPTGGNFIAEDSDYGTAAITQTVNGLTLGKYYTLTFSWAGAQQTGFSGASTDVWQVTLGGSPTQTTSIISVPSQGFTGWQTATMTFVATTTGSETLSFLAAGTPPNNVPAFALLANVSLVAASEPTGLAVLGVGMLGMVGLARRRRRLGHGSAVAA